MDRGNVTEKEMDDKDAKYRRRDGWTPQIILLQKYRIGVVRLLNFGIDGGSFCANGRRFFCRISFINLNFFSCPPSLLSLWGRRNQSSMMLVRYLRAPCCPSPSPEFSNPSIFKEKKNSTHLLPLLGSGKVAKKFPLPLDFHNRSHTSSARTQKSAPPRRAAESKVQLVSKWKMSFRKFLIAAAAIGVKGALPDCVNGCLSPYNTIWVYLSLILPLPLLLDVVSQQHGRRGARQVWLVNDQTCQNVNST